MKDTLLRAKNEITSFCLECKTAEYVEFQLIWQNHQGALFVVMCKQCGEFTPCKTRNHLPTENYEECKKAWNILNV